MGLRIDPPDFTWAFAGYPTGDAILDLTPGAVENVAFRVFVDFDRWYENRNTHPVQRLRIVNNSDEQIVKVLSGVYDLSGIDIYVCGLVDLLTGSGTLWDLL